MPQDESTLHAPVTPYGAAKDFAHTMVQVYRRRGMFASAAILYNHESPRRPSSFVARKITRAVASIARGSQDKLVLGNIDVLRDWGYAPDHVDGMLRILAAERADDYVVATGEARSVRDFVVAAFAAVGVSDWKAHVEIDPGLYRPADPRALVGDASRLRSLGWRPEVGFEDLVSIMVQADLDELDRRRPRPTDGDPNAHEETRHVPRPRSPRHRMTARTPSVLVVVPTLGERIETLEESLASVRAQEGVDAHLVVVVPDGAVEARDIAVKHGATLVSDPRRGLSAAVNAGIAARRDEEFYAWLGDDDLLVPGGLATLSRLLDADPSAVVAYGACPYIDDRGRTVTVSRAGDLAARILAWGPDLVPQPASLTRIEPLVAAGVYDESLRFAMDLDMFLRLKRLGRFVSTKQDVAAFRWHADSLTVANRGMSLAESEKVKRRYLRAESGRSPRCGTCRCGSRRGSRRGRSTRGRARSRRGRPAEVSRCRRVVRLHPSCRARSPAAAGRSPRPASGSAPRAGPSRSSGGC